MSNKPSIAILSYEAWRHPRALKIARSLMRHGYHVKLWGARKPFKHGPRILRSLMNYLLSIIEVSLLNADLYWIENIPDIIYMTIPFLGKKYIYDRRSPWAKEVQLEFGSKILYRFIELIERLMIKKAVYVTVASTPLLHEYRYNKPIAVIPNYPEINFKREPSKDLRKELGITNTTKIFTYVGKLSKIEGVDLLLKAANKVRETDSELWIVGDGPARNLVKKLSEEQHNVRWFGWVSREFLGDFLAASNYGLVPRHKTKHSVFYNFEGIQKIGEYFIYGKPVIASGIAPSPYYLVVEPEDFPSVLAKVAKGEITPPNPPEGFTWELHSEKIVLTVIREVCEKNAEGFT